MYKFSYKHQICHVKRKYFKFNRRYDFIYVPRSKNELSTYACIIKKNTFFFLTKTVFNYRRIVNNTFSRKTHLNFNRGSQSGWPFFLSLAILSQPSCCSNVLMTEKTRFIIPCTLVNSYYNVRAVFICNLSRVFEKYRFWTGEKKNKAINNKHLT